MSHFKLGACLPADSRFVVDKRDMMIITLFEGICPGSKAAPKMKLSILLERLASDPFATSRHIVHHLGTFHDFQTSQFNLCH